MIEKYDLAVIGAGPGGTPAAMAAAQFGKKVLPVDKRDAPGGECLFEGRIPSRVTLPNKIYSPGKKMKQQFEGQNIQQ